MAAIATSCPRAAASAVASARTCSSGERRRRSMPGRAGPKRTAPKSERQRSRHRELPDQPIPTASGAPVDSTAPASDAGRRRIRGDTRRTPPRRTGRTTSPSANGPALGVAQRAIPEQLHIGHQRNSAAVVECRAECHDPAAGRAKEGVDGPRCRGGAGHGRPILPVRGVHRYGRRPRQQNRAGPWERERLGTGGWSDRQRVPDAWAQVPAQTADRRRGTGTYEQEVAPEPGDRPAFAGIEIAARADEGGQCA